ncbi:hypothetical protein [Lacticaseibacillus saniviri]|uniref:Uncharacterized protein n=1 Tax=Lacticaseibacillus saniviri JCM 17471 = DSM 24301 TaxID=1293598 RepID=A0A0R2MSX1_9LACO|nr:hypothetical protein [Lacticaseibacillus saniviri]KRO15916.1 hypothetical protein IV56_GL002107 [Lacticaseibacillus saniviri JCM 17471 = DSM 24301]
MKAQTFALSGGLTMEIISDGQTISVALVAIGSHNDIDRVYHQIVTLAKETYGSPIAGFEL